MATKRDWVVTTSGDRPIADVVKELKQSGFHVDQVLSDVGLITGAGGDDIAEKLRKVKGVADVSVNAGADVGPPDSKVQ
jgi:hypothetical protein